MDLNGFVCVHMSRVREKERAKKEHFNSTKRLLLSCFFFAKWLGIRFRKQDISASNGTLDECDLAWNGKNGHPA